MHVDDIVRHEVHGSGLVLAVNGYDIEVRFTRGKREVHPVKLKVVLEAAQATDLLQSAKLPQAAVLWLRATDPGLRAIAARAWGRVTKDEHILIVARTIERWSPAAKEHAIEALTAARLERGLPTWGASVAEATARAAEDEARQAEREAARRQSYDDAIARKRDRDELQQLVELLDASEPIPIALHSRLLNHARRRRGEVELDEMEASQVIAQMARKSAFRRRESWCWLCKEKVSTPLNEECRYCGWFACWWCGSCESYRDADGAPTQMCRATAWARPEFSGHVDRDAHGVAILTPQPPAADAEAIRLLLERAGIEQAFHWSPARATTSILQHGILSPQELDCLQVGFVPHFYGYREKAALLWKYAALSFVPKFGMMETWSGSPVLFEVATDVLLTSDTLFVPGNSASSAFSAPDLQGMTGLHAAAALLDGAGRGPHPQSEAWIPRRVPRSAITRVLVHDQGTRTDLLAWLECHPDIPASEVGVL